VVEPGSCSHWRPFVELAGTAELHGRSDVMGLRNRLPTGRSAARAGSDMVESMHQALMTLRRVGLVALCLTLASCHTFRDEPTAEEIARVD